MGLILFIFLQNTVNAQSETLIAGKLTGIAKSQF